MSAFAGARPWWHARNRRERWMLGVMFVALAAFIAWYGLFVPLRHVRDASQMRYDRSLAELRQVQALANLEAAEKSDRPVLDTAQATRMILQAAEATGVAVSRRSNDAGGRLVVGVDSVAAPALFAWLDALLADHGLAPHKLQVERQGAGVRAEVTFRGQQ